MQQLCSDIPKENNSGLTPYSKQVQVDLVEQGFCLGQFTEDEDTTTSLGIFISTQSFLCSMHCFSSCHYVLLVWICLVYTFLLNSLENSKASPLSSGSANPVLDLFIYHVLQHPWLSCWPSVEVNPVHQCLSHAGVIKMFLSLTYQSDIAQLNGCERFEVHPQVTVEFIILIYCLQVDHKVSYFCILCPQFCTKLLHTTIYII